MFEILVHLPYTDFSNLKIMHFKELNKAMATSYSTIHFSTKCKQIVTKETGYHCVNTECTQGALSLFNANGEVSVGKPESEFSLHTSIADHTGSITQCRLNGTVIEEMLGWNVRSFLALFILMDFPIPIDAISMGLPMVYFKGSQVDFSTL